MIQLYIPPYEDFDEELEEFITFKGKTICLEHSLVSVSKWESKWHKPFLGKDLKTLEETIDYIRCMTITQNVSDEVYMYITNRNIEQVNEYIKDSMTATWFSEEEEKKTGPGRQEIITSELIYYWMIALQIPVEFQRWHLNRLLTLIKVCNIKNAPPKRMTRREALDRHRRLNQARRK